MKISIVMSTFNRSHLLLRSLRGYHLSDFDRSQFELIVVDDGSTDDTEKLCEVAGQAIPLRYIKAEKPKELGWRDCAATINEGLRLATGEVVVATHPEVIPGVLSLDHIWQTRKDWQYTACKVYYLTPRDQELIDTVPLAKEGNLAVRQIPGFYDHDPNILGPAEAYTHQATEAHTRWESWVFGAMTQKTWRDIGGMTEFNTWGSIDMDFMGRRQILGIDTLTLLDERTIVVHQNHDDPTKNIPTPRDMNAAMAALKLYRTREEAIHNYL